MNVVMRVRHEVDEWPDLSWLDQTDAQMGEGFEAYARERKAQYADGYWHMIGVIVELVVELGNGHSCVAASESVWGIESDSDESYLREVESDLAHELVDSIKE